MSSQAQVRPVLHGATIVVGVLLAAMFAEHIRLIAPPVSATVIASSAFLLIVVSSGAWLPTPMVRWSEGRRVVEALAVPMGVVALISATVPTAAIVRGSAPLIVVYLAWVEECVFRLMLPRSLGVAMAALGGRAAALLAVIISQWVFAAGHFLTGARVLKPDGAAALRLMVGGLLFWVIASRAGLTGAVITHALFNLHRVPAASTPAEIPSSIGITTVGVLTLAAIVVSPTSLDLKPYAQRNSI